MSDDGATIMEAIGNQNTIHGRGMYVIEGPEVQNLLYRVNIAPGHPKDQSSLCSEVSRCYEVVVTIHKICNQYNIQEAGIVLACDNVKALQ